jgi:hypothetical protein
VWSGSTISLPWNTRAATTSQILIVFRPAREYFHASAGIGVKELLRAMLSRLCQTRLRSPVTVGRESMTRRRRYS